MRAKVGPSVGVAGVVHNAVCMLMKTTGRTLYCATVVAHVLVDTAHTLKVSGLFHLMVVSRKKRVH